MLAAQVSCHQRGESSLADSGITVIEPELIGCADWTIQRRAKCCAVQVYKTCAVDIVTPNIEDSSPACVFSGVRVQAAQACTSSNKPQQDRLVKFH
jgi:hypothetical protein